MTTPMVDAATATAFLNQLIPFGAVGISLGVICLFVLTR